MSEVYEWDVAAAGNNSAAPDGFPEGMLPAALNNAMRELMASVRRFYSDPEYLNLSDAYTVTRPSASVIRIAGVDQTSIFVAGARVRTAGGASPEEGFVVSSAFTAGNTEVTVDYTADASTNEIRIHFGRSLGSASFYSVGSGAGQLPTNSEVINGHTPVYLQAIKDNADDTHVGSGFTRMTWSSGSGDGADYVTIPSANSSRNYLLSLTLGHDTDDLSAQGTWRVYVGANGTSADTLLYETDDRLDNAGRARSLGLPDLPLIAPASGARVSVYFGDVPAGDTMTVYGNLTVKPYCVMTIEGLLA